MAYLVGDAAQEQARQRTVAVGGHGDQVDGLLARLGDDGRGGLAARHDRAHRDVRTGEPRLGRRQAGARIVFFVRALVARVVVRHAQQQHLGAARRRQADDVVEHCVVDLGTIERHQDPGVHGHALLASDRLVEQVHVEPDHHRGHDDPDRR